MSMAAVSTAVLSSKRRRTGWKNATEVLGAKVMAIEKMAEMETHNSITKNDLVGALRWIYEHYDLLSVL